MGRVCVPFFSYMKNEDNLVHRPGTFSNNVTFFARVGITRKLCAIRPPLFRLMQRGSVLQKTFCDTGRAGIVNNCPQSPLFFYFYYYFQFPKELVRGRGQLILGPMRNSI